MNIKEYLKRLSLKDINDFASKNGIVLPNGEDKKIYNSAIECAEALNTSNVLVYNCCNHKINNKKHIGSNGETTYYQSRVLTVKGHHLFWLDEYEKMSTEELNKYIHAKHKRYKK